MQRLNPHTETIRTSIALEKPLDDAMRECLLWLNMTKSEFIREAIELSVKRITKGKRKDRRDAIKAERERINNG